MTLTNPSATDSDATDASAGWDDATQMASSSGSVHDFAWHRQHRSRRRVRPVDVAIIASWAAFLGWCLLYH
jgi:hypothetical protein